MKRVLSFMALCGLMFVVYVTAALVTAGFVGLENLARRIHDSDYFAVVPAQVAIEGAQRIEHKEILLLAGLDRRISWFDLDEHRMELFIRTNGWVKRCAVRAVFPNAVRIFVEEYDPAIVVYRRETRGEKGESLYAIWFADRDGVIFKKAFPGEHRGDLPLLFIEDADAVDRRIVQQALVVAAEWRKHRDLCLLRNVVYDIIDGFSLECEFPRSRRAAILLGKIDADAEVFRRGEIFRHTAHGLRTKRLFAGEYRFDDAETLVAGQLVHYRE